VGTRRRKADGTRNNDKFAHGTLPGEAGEKRVALGLSLDKWDKKHQFCKNEPEKLLKTKDRHLKMGQNEPENEPKKFFRISACGKNEPKRS
jgi:hypothetical protein